MAKILIFLIICFFVLFSCIPSGVQNTNNPDVTNEEDSEEEEELFNDTATEILLNSDMDSDYSGVFFDMGEGLGEEDSDIDIGSIEQSNLYRSSPADYNDYAAYKMDLRQEMLILAKKYKMPYDLLEAQCYQESGWTQWQGRDAKGKLITKGDPQDPKKQANGWGLMQITNAAKEGLGNGQSLDSDRYKNDPKYNLKVGVALMDVYYKQTQQGSIRKDGSFIPPEYPIYSKDYDTVSVDKLGRDIYESWYWALVQYNGFGPKGTPGKNNPNGYLNKTPAHFYKAFPSHKTYYQEISEKLLLIHGFELGELSYIPLSFEPIRFENVLNKLSDEQDKNDFKDYYYYSKKGEHYLLKCSKNKDDDEVLFNDITGSNVNKSTIDQLKNSQIYQLASLLQKAGEECIDGAFIGTKDYNRATKRDYIMDDRDIHIDRDLYEPLPRQKVIDDMISYITYNEKTELLTVEFIGGGAYTYGGVKPLEGYNLLLSSDKYLYYMLNIHSKKKYTLPKVEPESDGKFTDGASEDLAFYLHDAKADKKSRTFWEEHQNWTFPIKFVKSKDNGAFLEPDGDNKSIGFGTNRSGGRSHAGVDIVPKVPGDPLHGSSAGYEVIAVTSGTTIYEGQFREWYNNHTYYIDRGRILVVKNDDGSVVRYAEIEPLDAVVAKGSKITQGQVIAKIYQQCRGTGPRSTTATMLHFEVYLGDKDGCIDNPMSTQNAEFRYVPKRKYSRPVDLINPMGVFTLKDKRFAKE